jgi:hypothetical protein
MPEEYNYFLKINYIPRNLELIFRESKNEKIVWIPGNRKIPGMKHYTRCQCSHSRRVYLTHTLTLSLRTRHAYGGGT